MVDLLPRGSDMQVGEPMATFSTGKGGAGVASLNLVRKAFDSDIERFLDCRRSVLARSGMELRGKGVLCDSWMEGEKEPPKSGVLGSEMDEELLESKESVRSVLE